MNAMPVAWHEECLKNFINTLARKRGELSRLQGEVLQMEVEAFQYKRQIDIAREEKKEKFDRERFALSRLNL